MNSREIILKVLEIIEYTDDKQKFADEFMSVCLQKAMNDLSASLSEEKKVELKQRLSLVPPEKFGSILLEYFNKEEFEKAVESSSATIFQEYLEEILPTLKDDQKNELENYFSSNSFSAY